VKTLTTDEHMGTQRIPEPGLGHKPGVEGKTFQESRVMLCNGRSVEGLFLVCVLTP
jgi:hypothetical protein